jgi:hypothetical protein
VSQECRIVVSSNINANYSNAHGYSFFVCISCHFPQSYLAAAESTVIANTDEQFIVPTDGSPLRGLIQDHVE